MITADTIQIAGAGPAGLSAAMAVAERGRHGVVFERRDHVGARFHGDYQGLENWTTQGDVLDELGELGIAADFDCAPCREIVLFDPRGKAHLCRARRPLFYLVRRGNMPGTLDASLKAQVERRGVDIRFNQSVPQSAPGGVMCSGPHRPNIIAVGYVFRTDAADGVYAVVSDRYAPKGYAYLLIHRGSGTLAVCLFAGFGGREEYLERSLHFFQEHVGFAMTQLKRFGGLGHFGVPSSAVRDNWLLAGEAAGFQDALFGFGIRQAILSGYLAGRAWAENRPQDYDRLWRQRLGGLLRASVVNRSLYSLFGHPGYHWLVRRVSRVDDPREWLRRFYQPSLLKDMVYPLSRRLVY